MATITLSEIRKLSVAERIQLVEDIWDSVAEEAADLPITEPQRQELDRRRARAETHPGEGAPWNEVKAGLHRQGTTTPDGLVDGGQARLTRESLVRP